MQQRYQDQQLKNLDSLFECNQTIAFAPGSALENASISNIQISNVLNAGHDPMPDPNSSHLKDELYDWAPASHTWQAVTLDAADLHTEIKSGRSLANGDAEVGATNHPDWSPPYFGRGRSGTRL